jgi:hypothetical protein
VRWVRKVRWVYKWDEYTSKMSIQVRWAYKWDEYTSEMSIQVRQVRQVRQACQNWSLTFAANRTCHKW